MRTLVVLVAVLLGLAAPASAQEVPVDAQVARAQVVVVAAPGLRWDDVDPQTTPALDRLASSGAVGALSVKALPAVSCAGDGWLTLGAGARARAFGTRCGDLPADLAEQRRRNAGTRDGAEPDALARALSDGGRCLAARGPGAALTGGSARADCPVAVLDATVVGADGAARRSGAAAVDALVAAVDRARPAGSTLLVLGLSEAPTDRQAHLHVAIAAGPTFPAGALVSGSTRRAPYVQLVDVAPTVLDLLGTDVPEAMDGRPWRVDGAAPGVARLVDLDTRAVEGKRATVPFFVVGLAVLLVLLVALWRRPRALRLVALAGTALPVASYVAMLVPWWRAPVPVLALLGVTAVLAAAAALLLRRAALVLLLGALVMAVDLVAGAPLQLDSPAGYSPLVAGRFAGLGNVAFGVYGTCWLLGAALLVGARPRRGSTWRLAGLAVVAVLLDGGPAWGSDVGGVLALLPAFVVLGLRLAGRRVSVLRLAAACAGAAAVVVLLALVDLSRPADERTHLGRFAADVRDGTAGELLARKASAVLGLLFHSPVTALLPLVVAGAAWLVLRPPPPLQAAFSHVPALRAGLEAVGVMSLLGFVLNDSGAAVPALAIVVAAPATVAVVARVAELRAPLPDEAAVPVA